ncbi:MAG TPA: hypothetical protein VFJ82_15135 [Longimicrobium sp.]|nr:hypothetical protein [Longimicrobium sp.]
MDALHPAYVAVLAGIARYAPDALQRVLRILADEQSGDAPTPPAVELVRSWLVFTGHSERVEPIPPERVFSFAFPATMTFEMLGTGTPKSVARRALRALRAIEAEDVPLGAMGGPHPIHPALLNVHVWVGTYDGNGADRLRLELATDDDETED